MVSAPQRREGVRVLQEEGFSQRRSCGLVGIGRSSFRYVPHPRDDDGLAERLRKLARRRKRWGYRRAWVTLRRAGEQVNHKRVYRVWRKEGLSLAKRSRKKRPKPAGVVPCAATHLNHVWTYDFIHDACVDGRKLRMLTVVDEFTRECLAIEPARSLPAAKVIGVLSRLFAQHGAPEFLRSDNGPEFIAHQLKQWLAGTGPETIYIDPGSPWQNAYGESFNGKLRDECLNVETFTSLAEARVIIEQWRRDYNQERPHSSLGYQTPLEFKAAWHAQHGASAEDGNGNDLPPLRRGLSLCGPTDGLAENPQDDEGQSEVLCPRSVRPPAAALGSLPRVALSSARAVESLS